MHGDITLGDLHITFTCNTSTVTYKVTDIFTGAEEERTAPLRLFMTALSIATHPDGHGSRDDYALVEGIMGTIRWIP